MADRGTEYLYNLSHVDRYEQNWNMMPEEDIEKKVQPYLESGWEEEALPRVKLLTLNMSMELNTTPKRLEVLGQLVTQKRPDFIALQSVTMDSLKKMATMSWCAPYRASTFPSASEQGWQTTCAILSCHPPKYTKFFQFTNPEAHQQLLYAYYVMHDREKKAHIVTIATTQLRIGVTEDDSFARERHLNQAMNHFKEEEDCFLAGDFSIVDVVDGNQHLDGGWSDVWLCFPGNTPETGHTHVPDANTMIRIDKYHPRSRPDRIFFRSRRYRPDAIEMIFKDPVAELNDQHLSTHYGLLATFTVYPTDYFHPLLFAPEIHCTFLRPKYTFHCSDFKPGQKCVHCD